jgi:hypothetical protein
MESRCIPVHIVARDLENPVRLDPSAPQEATTFRMRMAASEIFEYTKNKKKHKKTNDAQPLAESRNCRKCKHCQR